MRVKEVVMASALFGLFGQIQHDQQAGPKLRPPAVAGSFYPAEREALAAMMDKMLAQVPAQTIDGEIVAAVAPHAGYPYSGPVAAYTYAALRGQKIARVIVIAPSHYEGFDFTSVYDGDGYVTPLGTIPVDKAFAQKLAKESSSIRLSERGHTATARGGEHALEVQLPWLQHVLGNLTLVPVVMGDQSYDSSRALGTSIANLLKQEEKEHETGRTLIVASSDLSHYHSYSDANKMDQKTLGALHAWDYLSMSRNLDARIWEACGGAPIMAAMVAAERLGATDARVLKYANSGDTSGDRSRVVGYSADIFVRAKTSASVEPGFSLNEEERRELLAIARKSVEHAVLRGETYIPSAPQSETLHQERGAFVTLTIAGNLRGCIGYTSAFKPLYLTVRDTSAFAALRDPRFHPVRDDDLPKLQYEISVLSPLRRVTDVHDIRVGQDGLLMKNGDREGLLLPQVAAEHHWDRERFVQETCFKAGMEPGCWKDQNTDIFRFTAEVFSEHELKAP